MSLKEVNSALEGLAKEFKLQTFTSSYKTHEKRDISGAVIGGLFNGRCTESYRVFFNSAIHARERGASDNLLYFLGDLLYADKANTGLAYGKQTYTNAQVRKALTTGIVFLPVSNPDGLAYDQATHLCWRKNRNPASAKKGDPNSIGVDLNRNFDFAWDSERMFHPQVAQKAASSDPASNIFHGLAPF